jgi:hypothetical protein
VVQEKQEAQKQQLMHVVDIVVDIVVDMAVDNVEYNNDSMEEPMAKEKQMAMEKRMAMEKTTDHSQ